MNYNEELIDLLRKLEPLNRETALLLWNLLLVAKDKKAFFDTRNLLRLLASIEANNTYEQTILLPPPNNKQVLLGRYHLGEVLYPKTVYSLLGLEPLDFMKHILITGITGAGKTNLSLLLLQELAKKNQPFLIFDWKHSYRKLKMLPECHNLKIISLGEEDAPFHFNPLIPPKGTHPKHWMTMLTDVIKHSFFVAHGVEYFFRKGIDYLYQKNGVYEGSENYPTFRDLEKLLRKEFVRGREMLWMSSVKRVMSILTFSGMLGDIVNAKESNSIESLLTNQVVIEMDNLSTVEKIFFVESFLLWLYHYKKQKGATQTHHLTIVIEEAHHILSGKKEFEQGEETIIETMIRMIREFGVGIIAIDQEPSKLSQSILANTNTKICFTLGNGKDIDTIMKSISLPKEQRAYLDQLQVGHAILKSKNRFIEPVHIRIPLMKIKSEIPAVGYPLG